MFWKIRPLPCRLQSINFEKSLWNQLHHINHAFFMSTSLKIDFFRHWSCSLYHKKSISTFYNPFITSWKVKLWKSTKWVYSMVVNKKRLPMSSSILSKKWLINRFYFAFSVPFKDHPKYNPRRRTSACPSASSSSALSSPHPGFCCLIIQIIVQFKSQIGLIQLTLNIQTFSLFFKNI